ncbi:unnamed protein product [Effrenium voratum]|nr:unnamed protein product [Effrenium voratum]
MRFSAVVSKACGILESIMEWPVDHCEFGSVSPRDVYDTRFVPRAVYLNMPSGKLKKFVSDKGFGFITPDDGGEDVFAHTLQFSGDGDSLRGGERVQFEAEWDDRKGKYRAASWSVDTAAAAAVMLPGVLKKFFQDKGFGFIEPQDGSEDLFAHSRQFTGGDATNISEGTKVKYEVEWDSKKGKNKAGSWCLDTGDSGCGGYGCGGCGGCGGGGGYGCGGGGGGCGGYPMQQSYGGGMGAPQYGGGGGYGPMGGGQSDPRYSPYGAPAPGGYGGGSSLPPGWEQTTDPSSGKTYYFNRATNETSWTPPAAHAPPPTMPAPGGLPPGWETAQDPNSGKTYYFNRSTNETRWDPPM